MKKIKSIHKMEMKDKPLFCTECGEKLEDFCFTNEAENLEKIRKHHEHCKAINKFNGEQCAKLFIAEPTEPLDQDEL